jgi:predicted nucleotidyltransferase
MVKSESGTSIVYSSGLISGPKGKPYCFEKVDESAFYTESFSTKSQSKVTILSYPDDAFWRSQADQKALPLAEALEDITGLPLSLSGDVRVREAAPVSELRGTRLGDYRDGLARVSENFNSETLAHELAHHWFGEGIADNWVFEGLAEYLGQRAIESTGEALEEKACSKGWYLPQKDAKQPLSLSSWEFVSSNAESSAVDGKIERINGLYKNACAIFATAVAYLDPNDRASVYGSFARGSTTFNPVDDQPLTASEAIDLLILADNLDGTNLGLQWTIDDKLGLLAPNDEAGLAARELGLAKYAPTFRWLASVGWSAPTFVASPLASQDYATSTQAIDALDQAAIVKGYSSWAALVQEAVTLSQSITATPEDLVRIGNFAAATTDVATAIQAYLDIVSVAKNLASLQSNSEGSPDPVSALGRLVVGNVVELQAQSLKAFGEGDLKVAQQLSQSAIFARDMAWAIGSTILLLLLALVVLLSYRTPGGRKRIDLLMARLLSKRKRKRSAA